MTEKIIIDCAFYKDGVCASPINKTCEYCKNIDVSKCYHKQLKRSEQDSKQLTQWLDEARRNADFWCDKCTGLEQENKELKAYKDVNEDFKKAWDELNKKYTEVLKLAKLNADSNEYCLKKLEKENKRLKEEIQFHNKENSNLLAERNAAQIGYDEIREVRERYRSALEEIKNVLKEICKEECDYTKPKFCGDCDCRYGQILTKINEVLK